MNYRRIKNGKSRFVFLLTGLFVCNIFLASTYLYAGQTTLVKLQPLDNAEKEIVSDELKLEYVDLWLNSNLSTGNQTIKIEFPEKGYWKVINTLSGEYQIVEAFAVGSLNVGFIDLSINHGLTPLKINKIKDKQTISQESGNITIQGSSYKAKIDSNLLLAQFSDLNENELIQNIELTIPMKDYKPIRNIMVTAEEKQNFLSSVEHKDIGWSDSIAAIHYYGKVNVPRAGPFNLDAWMIFRSDRVGLSWELVYDGDTVVNYNSTIELNFTINDNLKNVLMYGKNEVVETSKSYIQPSYPLASSVKLNYPDDRNMLLRSDDYRWAAVAIKGKSKSADVYQAGDRWEHKTFDQDVFSWRTGWENYHYQKGIKYNQQIEFVIQKSTCSEEQLQQPIPQVTVVTNLDELDEWEKCESALTTTTRINDGLSKSFKEWQAIPGDLVTLPKIQSRITVEKANEIALALPCIKQNIANAQNELHDKLKEFRKLLEANYDALKDDLGNQNLDDLMVAIDSEKTLIRLGAIIEYIKVARWAQAQDMFDKMMESHRSLLEKESIVRKNLVMLKRPGKISNTIWNWGFSICLQDVLLNSPKPAYRDPVRANKVFEILENMRVKDVTLGLNWSYVEPKKDEYHYNHLKELYSKLAAAGVERSMPVIGSWLDEYFPPWVEKDYSNDFAEKSDGTHHDHLFGKWPLTPPDLVEKPKIYNALNNYLKHAMPVITSLPTVNNALFANNEPLVGQGGYDEQSVKAFQAWLKKRFKTINNFNEVALSRYESFDQIKPPTAEQLRKLPDPDTLNVPPAAGKPRQHLKKSNDKLPLPGNPRCLLYEWIRFRAYALSWSNKFMADAIWENDPEKLPVSPKSLSNSSYWSDAPYGSQYNFYSTDFYEQARSTKGFFGQDNYLRKDFEVLYVLNQQYYLNQPSRAVIGETSVCERENAYAIDLPSPAQTLRVYWEAVPMGLKGIYFFNWNFHDLAPLSYAYSDLSPKPEAIASCEMNATLRVLKPLLADAEPIKAEIACYFPRACQIQDWRVGKDHTMFYSWLAYHAAGFTMTYVDDDAVGKLRESGIKALILPYALYLENNAAEKIVDFVKSGGILITEGKVAAYDEYARKNSPQIQALNNMLGVKFKPSDTVNTVSFMDDNGSIELKQNQSNCVLQDIAPDAEIIAGYSGGEPAAAIRKVGKGEVLIIGYPTANVKQPLIVSTVPTSFSDMGWPTKVVPQIDFLKERNFYRPIRTSDPISHQTIYLGEQKLALLINTHGQPRDATFNISFFSSGEIIWDILEAEKFTVDSDKNLKLNFKPDQIRLLIQQEK
ncbi:MAG: beta-galactosidase [Planctomycetota bacterium]